MKLKITRKGRKKLACFFLHNWEKVKDTGHTQYYKCKRCGRREIIQYSDSGYQPIDIDFIKDKELIKISKIYVKNSPKQPNVT